MSGALYDYVMEQIEFLKEGIDAAEQEKNELFDRKIEYILGQLEGFSASDAALMASRLKAVGGPIVDGMFEDAILRRSIKNIPKMVGRIREIEPIANEKLPSDAVQAFLRGATQTYIFGLWEATVALSRAALERVLKDKLVGELERDEDTLQVLIKASFFKGCLDAPHFEMAEKVRLIGNRVLHGERTDREGAWEALWSIRGVLQHLHG